MQILKIHNLILLFILLLAIFFRIYNLYDLMGFALDADLYSWIVKDILIDSHIRLVGQMTSEQGVYIGPLFYYLLIPFFLLTNLDPIGSAYFGVFIGVITVISFYFVFKKLINTQAGLIAAFLQSILTTAVGFDRWIVPTMLTTLWCIWYFYSLVKIIKGDIKYVVLTLFLIGLIWHIHLALAPLIILLPIAIILSKKIPNIKIICLGVIAFLIPMLPFIIFEIRHDFLQTFSMLSSFSKSNINLLKKTLIVLNHSLGQNIFLKILVLILPVILFKLKIIEKKLLVIFYCWTISIIGFFILSSKESSQYYYTSIQSLFLFLLIYFLSAVTKKRIGLIIGIAILGIVFIYSLNNLINFKDDDKGYSEKKAAVEFIKNDASLKDLPCYSITFINSPGENTGFKYLFWRAGLKGELPKEELPNYTLVIPSNLAKDSVKESFGLIGVIPPDFKYNEQTAYACTGIDQNLTQPLWGFTN